MATVLQTRPLMGGLLNHLAADPPASITRVLTVLAQRVLAPRSGVGAKLRAEAFGDVALQQVCSHHIQHHACFRFVLLGCVLTLRCWYSACWRHGQASARNCRRKRLPTWLCNSADLQSRKSQLAAAALLDDGDGDEHNGSGRLHGTASVHYCDNNPLFIPQSLRSWRQRRCWTTETATHTPLARRPTRRCLCCAPTRRTAWRQQPAPLQPRRQGAATSPGRLSCLLK